VLGLVLATGQSGACVAECSVRLPVVARDARPAIGTTPARWSHEIDPRFDLQPARRGSADTNLAANADTIVVADNGRLVALDAATGRERWRTAASHLGIPVIVGDTVVAANARRQTGAFDGASRSIDAFALRDGTPVWSVGLPELKPQPPSNPPYAAYPRILPQVAAARAGDGVLVSTTIDGVRPYEQDLLITEIDEHGALRWRRVLGQGNVGRVSVIHGSIAYLASVEDGSIIHDVVRLVRLGTSGGVIGDVGFAIGPLAWNAHGEPLFENAFSIGSTVFAVEMVPLEQFTGDVETNIDRTTWTYTPDGLPGDPGFGEVGIEGASVYGLIHYASENGTARLYRYRLAAPDGQSPALLDTGVAQWVAGPSHGWNVVEDDDGLEALRVRDDGREERVRLAHIGTSISIDATAFDGHRLYVARYDGRVQGFDLDAATTILDAPTSCVPDDMIDRQHAWRSIGVHGDRLLAVCARRVYAFARSSYRFLGSLPAKHTTTSTRHRFCGGTARELLATLKGASGDARLNHGVPQEKYRQRHRYLMRVEGNRANQRNLKDDERS